MPKIQRQVDRIENASLILIDRGSLAPTLLPRKGEGKISATTLLQEKVVGVRQTGCAP
jgi:hypothetical protein